PEKNTHNPDSTASIRDSNQTVDSRFANAYKKWHQPGDNEERSN
nr:hypothetical protein [Tanacetum cinerariifolium]